MTICGCLFSEKRSKERTDLKYWTCFNEYLKIRTCSTTDKHVEILQQMTLTNLDHPSHLHAHQPGVGCSLAVEREAAPSPVHNHNIDILRSDQGRGHVLASDQWEAFIRTEGLIPNLSTFIQSTSPWSRKPWMMNLVSFLTRSPCFLTAFLLRSVSFLCLLSSLVKWKNFLLVVWSTYRIQTVA